jgi:hypothetical protein
MKIIMFFFLIISFPMAGQIMYDFENSSAGLWMQSDSGRWDTSSFNPVNGNYSLHHIYDNAGAGHDQISLSHHALLLDSATVTWQFKIRHGYNPSSNNNWAVFLVSDKSSSYMYPGADVNGYVLGVNFAGNDDLVKLWKVTSGNTYEIASTNFNWQENAGTAKNVEFEVTRNIQGHWTINAVVTAHNSTTTETAFNNPATLGTAMDSEHNYSLFFGIYYKYSATQDQQLWFDDLYINGYFYDDSISNLFYNPGPYDILITEIMADPEPPVLLPEFEYIEVFNKSNYDINLSGWRIAAGNSQVTLPRFIIKSKDYSIITKFGNNFGMEYTTDIIYAEGFPSLNNSGQTVTIKDKNNSAIHSVSYSDKWYKTNYKSEGGWSLEIIDVNNPCGKGVNWAESTDIKGGTPGEANSSAGHNPDNTSPFPKRVAVISDSAIQICFNEPMDSLSLINCGSYSVDNNIGYAASIIPVYPDFSTVKLGFDNVFKKEILYTITMDNEIKDCAGNALHNNSKASFAVPEAVDSLDLVINEVLFNAGNNGADFVELYNRSKKNIDIQYFCISVSKLFSEKTGDYNPVTREHFLLFPGEYVIISADTSIISENYAITSPNCMIEPETLPSFPNNEGIVIITDNRLNILDKLHYSEDMHFKLLNSPEGVSLERISSERPTNDINNWHSASEDSKFATPGYRNSQNNDFEPPERQITVYPEVFSPDNDGYNDYVNIYYRFDEPGSIANVTVFDSKGRIVKRLVRNTMLGTEGVFIWDGATGNNTRAAIGIYLIYTEIFDLNGKIYKFKNICVLALKI